MTRQYKTTLRTRILNGLFMGLNRLGLLPKGMYILSTRGRKSGKLRRTPVSLVERDGQRWLVAPFGAVGWVHNARAAGEVTLRHGRKTETVRIEELAPQAAAPILKVYLGQQPTVRPYFAVTPESPVEAFAQVAAQYPVFLLKG